MSAGFSGGGGGGGPEGAVRQLVSSVAATQVAADARLQSREDALAAAEALAAARQEELVKLRINGSLGGVSPATQTQDTSLGVLYELVS